MQFDPSNILDRLRMVTLEQVLQRDDLKYKKAPGPAFLDVSGEARSCISRMLTLAQLDELVDSLGPNLYVLMCGIIDDKHVLLRYAEGMSQQNFDIKVKGEMIDFEPYTKVTMTLSTGRLSDQIATYGRKETAAMLGGAIIDHCPSIAVRHCSPRPDWLANNVTTLPPKDS